MGDNACVLRTTFKVLQSDDQNTGDHNTETFSTTITKASKCIHVVLTQLSDSATKFLRAKGNDDKNKQDKNTHLILVVSN